jgi:hypothetical protein
VVGVKETTTGEAVLPWRGETLSHSGIVVGSTVKYADDPELMLEVTGVYTATPLV